MNHSSIHPFELLKITIWGYKSINCLDGLELRPFNVLVGANGSGKSNLISFFSLVSHMMDKRLQQYVTKGGQASSFLYQGPKKTKSLGAEMHFGSHVYIVELEPTVKGELMYVKEDILFEDSADKFELADGGYFETHLLAGHEKDAVKKFAESMAHAIGSWKVYHFHDTSPTAPVKQRGEVQDNNYLRPDASNLAPFLFRLKREYPANYEAIRDAVRQVAPFFHDFKLNPVSDNPNIINLEWTAVNSDFPFRVDQLSDGTLRFICLATLLLQPNMPAAIIIDEPELGLHPYAISCLSSLLKKASTRTQVIVATQSVTLIDTCSIEDLIVVERRDGESVFERPNPERFKEWLCEYSLGQLWEKNILGGRPAK